MKTISASTFFMKRVFPFLMLVPVAGAFAAITHVPPGRSFNAMVLLPLLFVAVIVVVIYRKMIWDLADEVKDGGSYLLVRRGSIEVRVQLAEIINVSMSQYTNPPRLSLRLAKPCKLGDEIVFMPTRQGLGLNPFTRNPVAEDLMQRVDRARREQR
ncbi:MAG: hypothetical protein JSS44_06440 [Proteobacteria bacterium]|nr:hypothetical protein [Pseudomonadota bacterium]